MQRIPTITAGLLLGVSFATTAHSDLLDDIRTDATFTVGTEARFAPFEYIEDGEIVGYSADIMEHIMSELEGVELIRMDLPWQGILPGLERERFDYVITSVTATPERMERYHLSAPIADATMAMLKRAGEDDISSPEDIAGKVAAAQAGSAQLEALEALAAELEETGTPVADIRTYTGVDEAYAELGTGRVDVVINSLPNLLEAERTRPDVFEVVGTFGDPVYFSWAGRDDEESASLNAFMDEQIQRLNEDGTLNELQEKWFGGPMDLPLELPAAE
ncbi:MULTISPECIES: transporter substrate-binding domain-containing protein [Halomonadaceae]|jgi:polar amino acid transport system substrate-binding protein|uniref:ABC transporter substrate-binding protein n=1 Tax=Vreelandella aquamarina TaxID=77097 RepID=A0A6F8XEZ1_9GAMM|nr:MULTISPECIES: transporter substrate-binding domain-containing protein [Halomonas]KTG25292.1 ABC transporter substrate-binding protein [Idiomarina sp. H105]MEC9304237.1 transporter substrate-binding domain-containing protein [Pseudomonadota bacterium]OAE95228.1 ABC transporter substrate-binding protein [Idiomarina sp. WRN-38]MCC4287814.1 transporter substrate-binding domain-containing protein [Halomonas meridiana]MCC4292087.1 transporter substrate-binding domain-containing protein [Halomonas|tara:strand:+ start:3416 stop:4243 length:828 start_codon:yes stop_codon:yes gene_type:complete